MSIRRLMVAEAAYDLPSTGVLRGSAEGFQKEDSDDGRERCDRASARINGLMAEERRIVCR